VKIFKRIMAVLLVLALFAGSFAGSFILFNRGTYDYDVQYLSVLDEDDHTYYLSKAPANIKFRVDLATSGTDLEYTVYDSEGDEVSVKSERVTKSDYNILPPADGYEPGERYTLELGNGVAFTDENLKNAQVLVFCIDREEVEEYTFTEDVVETAQVIEEISEDTISVAGLNAQPGQILFGTNDEGEYVVHKISEIMGDGTAKVTTPAIDEIYSDLDIYGEYEFDVDELTTNPDLEIEIVENVKKSPFYAALITTAYAADMPKDGTVTASITPDKKSNSLNISITITLQPGENGLFGMAALRNHSVTVILNSKLGLKMNANIKGASKWDVSGTVTSGFSWEVDISRIIMNETWDSSLEDLFKDKDEYKSFDDYYIHKQHQNAVKKITDSLNQIAADATGGELKLFDWKLPIASVPGLYFSAEVMLFAEFELTASVVIGQESTTVYTVGVYFANKKFESYSNTYKSNGDISLSLRGKASAKAGVKLVVGATLINAKVANINVDPQVGLYAEVYATIPIVGMEQATEERFIYSYFEPGVYFSANITAHLNLLVKKFDFSYQLIEKKFPIKAWTLGNEKIATGILTNAQSVRAIGNTVKPPDVIFEYYDVKSGISKSEVLSLSDLKFVSNEGKQLDTDHGELILPEATTTDSCYVTATYLHTDGKTYSTVFRVLISGSILEGKVSAYTDDVSAGTLEGARVELYTQASSASPISIQNTDENGKFSFNVAEGDYRIVISADGYRTLTSSQHVEADEIKYTEHILLMDDDQSGVGSAGGTLTNALDGRGVSGAQLKLRSDWNNTDGAYVDFVTTTNSSGHYTIENVPVGYYTVEASMNGYVKGYANVIVLKENPKDDFDFTITPTMAADQTRIVLSWGADPSDLDSHLIGRTPNNDTFNVYYNDKAYHFDGVEMANLDVDDTSSYGPETITILEDIYGVYTYAVHDYSNRNSSNSTDLSYSGAVVKVFVGSNQVAEYHVPTDQVGTYWTVFQIDSSGRVRPVNTISNEKPAA